MGLRPAVMLVCTQSGCSAPAVRALVNALGYVHLECEGHVGTPRSSPDVGRMFRAPPEAMPALRAAGMAPPDSPYGTGTLEVPLELVLVLQVMGS